MLHGSNPRQRPLSRRLVAALAVLAIGCKATSPEVDKAVGYFVARGDAVDPLVLLIGDFLQRKHGLARLAPVVARLKQPIPDLKHPDPEFRYHLEVYARLADPAAQPTLERLKSASNDMDRLGLEALYCDLYGGVALEKRLRELAKPGKYYVTHAALYAGWALENGCLAPAIAKALGDELAPKLEVLYVDEGGPTDLGMEALAMLYFIGHGDRVKPEWIAAVKKAQRPDGGWTHGPMGPTNDHSSMLGLWVLAEATWPNAKQAAWFKRSAAAR